MEVLQYSGFLESHTCWQIEVRSYNLITSLPVAAINRTHDSQRKLPKVKLPVSDQSKTRGLCRGLSQLDYRALYQEQIYAEIIHCRQFLSFNTNRAMLSKKKNELLQSGLKSDVECFTTTF